MKKVFISYSSKEYDIAAKLRKAFTDRGLLVWMAPESIPAGSNYAVEIPKAIQSCDIVVLLLSENSQNSIWVQREIDTAVNNNKLLFPVKTDNYQLIPPFDFYLTDIQVSQETEEPEIVANKLCKTLGLDVEETDIQTITKKKFSLKSPKGIALMASAAVLTALITVLVPVFLKPSAMEYTIVDSVGMFEFTGEYKGELKKGLPDGIGEFTGINSDNTQFTYNGEFRNGEIDGKGVGYYEDEASTVTYDGEWDDNLPNGFGTRTDFYKEGDIEENKYIGYFENWFLTGQGEKTYKYRSGLYKSNTEEGEFKYGELEGYGSRNIIFSADQENDFQNSLFTGIFSNGELNGQGSMKLIYTDSDILYFEGVFIDGKLNGTGTEEVHYKKDDDAEKLETSTFVGNFNNNKKTGVGEQTKYFKNGNISTYYGEFKDGMHNGEGKLIITYAEGTIKKKIDEGTFIEDRLAEGKRTVIYSNNENSEIIEETVEGHFDEEGTSDGYIILRRNFKNGESSISEGEYFNGEFNGYFREIYTYNEDDQRRQKITVGNCVDGYLVGAAEHKMIYKDNQIAFVLQEYSKTVRIRLYHSLTAVISE